MPLVILDRDGVINYDSDDYIRSVRDWRPIPGSIEAIAALSRAGFHVAVATNQSGLGRGYFTRDDLDEIHARMRAAVAAQGGHLAGIFYCPHLPDEGCKCRKPAPGLLQDIARELQQPLQDAFFVGDSMSDLQAGQACGCRVMLVRTGNGEATLRELTAGNTGLQQPRGIPLYKDLAAAARAMLNT